MGVNKIHNSRPDQRLRCLNEIENIFKSSNEKPWVLTTKGFNLVSSISVKTCIQYTKNKWIEIIRKYNKYEDLFSYLCKEYKDFLLRTGSGNIHLFVKKNPYFTYGLISEIGIDKLRESCSYTKQKIYSLQDLKENMLKTKDSLGYVPLYSEFVALSNIPLETYANKLKLKVNIYDQLIQMYFSIEDRQNYLMRKNSHKRDIGKKTGSMARKINDQDLESEFRRVFEKCIKDSGTFPSKLVFNDFSKYSESTFRKRLNRSWSGVCSFYGYELDNRLHSSEKILLGLIRKIISCNFEGQKTWDWLIGTGGKHMYCDGYFHEKSLVIEFDGRQHRVPVEFFGGKKAFARLKENEKLKSALLSEHSINLIRIDSREAWSNEEYLRDLLSEYI